jgi:hypothetical protein
VKGEICSTHWEERNMDLHRKFFFWGGGCVAIGIAAIPGLLCQSRAIVKMIVEKQMQCRLTGETEVLGENLLQCHFYPSQNSTWPDPGSNPGVAVGSRRLTAWAMARPARKVGFRSAWNGISWRQRNWWDDDIKIDVMENGIKDIKRPNIRQNCEFPPLRSIVLLIIYLYLNVIF